MAFPAYQQEREADQVKHRGDLCDLYVLPLHVLLQHYHLLHEAISAMVLVKMKETTETYIGHKFTHTTVVTLPRTSKTTSARPPRTVAS